MADVEDLSYSRGALSVKQLQEEIAGFWAELRSSPELQAEVAAAGLDTDVLDEHAEMDAITVRPDSSGVAGEVVLLIIAFAPTGNRMLKDLWATILLPRIRRRWGDDAIGGEHRKSKQGEHRKSRK